MWLDCVPLPDKTADAAYRGLRRIFGRSHIRTVHSDDAPKLEKALKDLGILHDTGFPGRHNSNAYAEQAVRSVEEGARLLLEHAGLPWRMWQHAVQYYRLMYNITVRGGGSPWASRHGAPFSGLRIPFGSLVNFMPSDARRGVDVSLHLPLNRESLWGGTFSQDAGGQGITSLSALMMACSI